MTELVPFVFILCVGLIAGRLIVGSPFKNGWGQTGANISESILKRYEGAYRKAAE